MASKYTDIIKIRESKAAYNIVDEKDGEWRSFIPNRQFNDDVLKVVLKSVRGNDIDFHKSFWINGTYGTGKSHAVSVLSHLLGDPVDTIKGWVDYAYKSTKFEEYRDAIYAVREKKRLLPVNLYGQCNIAYPSDLAPILQKAIVTTLERLDIRLEVPTDFDNYANHIQGHIDMWKSVIEGHIPLFSIVSGCDDLIQKLKARDLGTYHCVVDALRKSGITVNLQNEDICQWLIEVQDKLSAKTEYNGLLIIWDEFTDVAVSPVGIQVLKELQKVVERFANIENNSYIFLISHPNAIKIKTDQEQYKQTVGRYHWMKYNMEPVSAFRIMSGKFEIVDKQKHDELSALFYSSFPSLPAIYSRTSNDQKTTEEDLVSLYPLHPGTANLATHYATVIGSSSRSVFEFLGQNEAIRLFLENEEEFLNHRVITADYLWDYVQRVFQDDAKSYSAVTERYHSYCRLVENKSKAHLAVFKSVLLLNAFNNVSAENNNGLVTPSEENIHNLFTGSQYELMLDDILQWFGEQGVIQRDPSGLYSVQFSALPAAEIEESKRKKRETEFKHTYKILRSTDEARKKISKTFLPKLIRDNRFEFFSDVQNEALLRNQIKSERKQTKSSALFFALLFARNQEELTALQSFARRCAEEPSDNELNNIIFAVFDETFTDKRYEQFIEYHANMVCASNHSDSPRAQVCLGHAVTLIKDWLDIAYRGTATLYVNSMEARHISVRNFSVEVNAHITPFIFPSAPDAHENLREVAQTFWKPQNSKDIVRKFLSANTRHDLEELRSPMNLIRHLIQDCLNSDLSWKEDIPLGHPFKEICDKVADIIKRGEKSNTFNLDERFSVLTRPPYGLSSNFASMASMAFALRPWVGKIFDPQGKPRTIDGLADDISSLFKVWDEGKPGAKLNFKFQTKDEGSLCKALVSLFNLTSSGGKYNDISSLTDARFAIISDYLAAKKSPLWSLKYVPQEFFASMPFTVSISEQMRKLIDNIVEICNTED